MLAGTIGIAAPHAAAQRTGNAELIRSGEQADRYQELIDEYGDLRFVRMSIDFPGGSAEAYLDLLTSTIGVRNVVVRGPLEEADMVEVRLTSVPYKDALMLLEEAELGDFGGVGVEWEGEIARIHADPGPYGDNPGDAAEAEDEERETLVYAFATGEDEADRSATPLIDRALEAVEAAALFVDDADLDISVHEPTGMLFARGRVPSLEVIAQTVDRLRDRAEHAFENAEVFRDREEQFERMVREARSEVEEAAERLEGELAEQREEVARLRERLERVVAERTDLEALVERLREQLMRVRGRLGERERRD
jgi:hypothetical protein